jgi:putative copper resistance protein D
MDNFLLLPRAMASSLLDAAMAGLVGVLLARLWLNGIAADRSLFAALSKTFLACSILLAITLPAQLWLMTAVMTGSSAPNVILPQLLDVQMHTHAGRVLLPVSVLSLCLLIIAAPRLSIARLKNTYLRIGVLLLILLCRSASGHAASDGNFTVSEFVQFVHLSSIAVWAGGVMIAGLVVLPHQQRIAPADHIAAFGRSLSTSSTIAVVIVILSGLYNAWRGLGTSLQPLVHTQWGALLLLKITFVLGALGLGATNRLMLNKDHDTFTMQDAQRFVTRVRFEAVIMIGILLISGLLAGSPPATGS